MYDTKSYRMFRIFNSIILLVLTISFILPMFLVFSSSIISAQERVERGSFVFFPRSVDLTAYKIILGTNSNIYTAYGNTLFLVTVGTFLSLLTTSMLAYGISKKFLPGRTIFITIIFITMLFSGGLVPTYLLVKALHLTDSLWALILPGVVSAWNTMVMRNFFYSIPDSLEESALLDGATPIIVFIKIILPLSKAVLAAIGMFYAVGYWYSWFPGVIYINDVKKLPLQNLMRNVIALYSSTELDKQYLIDELTFKKPPMESLQMATIVIGTVPVLLVYPFAQKYFVKGIMIGSIKG